MQCGCFSPRDGHSSKANITLKDLTRAAAISGIPVMEAASNIPATVLAATEPGWPPEDAPLTVKPTLVWDCDGILSFTAEGLCAALNAKFGTRYGPQSQGFFPGTLLVHRLPPEQGAWAQAMLSNPVFLAALAPDFHALDTLIDAYNAGWACEVTTERAPECENATREWLDGWGVPPVSVHAVGHGNKPGWMASRYGPPMPAVLIDDSPLAQTAIARPGISVWSPQRPYTPPVHRAQVRDFPSWRHARYWLGLGPRP